MNCKVQHNLTCKVQEKIKLVTVLEIRVAESQAFGWSRIPNNTRSRGRIFCPTLTPEVQSDHFLHHTLIWVFLLKRYNFF